MAVAMTMAVTLPMAGRPRITTIAALLFPALANPAFLDEVHRLVARAVAAAIGPPVALMAWRHVQIDRLALHDHRRWRDNDRLGVDQCRLRIVADIDASVDARLVDADR